MEFDSSLRSVEKITSELVNPISLAVKISSGALLSLSKETVISSIDVISSSPLAQAHTEPLASETSFDENSPKRARYGNNTSLNRADTSLSDQNKNEK